MGEKGAYCKNSHIDWIVVKNQWMNMIFKSE